MLCTREGNRWILSWVNLSWPYYSTNLYINTSCTTYQSITFMSNKSIIKFKCCIHHCTNYYIKTCLVMCATRWDFKGLWSLNYNYFLCTLCTFFFTIWITPILSLSHLFYLHLFDNPPILLLFWTSDFTRLFNSSFSFWLDSVSSPFSSSSCCSFLLLLNLLMNWSLRCQ